MKTQIKIKLLILTTVLVGFTSCKEKPKQKIEDVITNEINVEGQEVTYSTDSTQMKGYIAFYKKM